jgi:LAGLIDADG-like domain
MATDISEIAWAAGLFEGEGTMYIANDRWRQPTVSVTSTDLDVLEKFASIMGVGKVYKRQDNRKETYKTAYKWSVQSRNDVVQVLELLMPFLCSRRKAKAEELLARAYEMVDKGSLKRERRELLVQLGLKREE